MPMRLMAWRQKRRLRAFGAFISSLPRSLWLFTSLILSAGAVFAFLVARQGAAIDAIQRSGGSVRSEAPDWFRQLPDWLKARLPNGFVRGLEEVGTVNLAYSGDDRVLKRVGQLRRVDQVLLAHAAVTDGGIACLARQSALSRLDLSYTLVTDGGLENLRELSSLTVLDLSGTEVTTLNRLDLKRLPRLRAIGLSGTHVSDPAVARLSSQSALDWLGLGNTAVTDAALKDIGRLRRLKHLYLNGTAVTDDGLIHLKALNRLEFLRLDNTRITDKGLAHLIELRSLTGLNVTGTRVTEAGVRQLGRALPSLFRVFHDADPLSSGASLVHGYPSNHDSPR